MTEFFTAAAAKKNVAYGKKQRFNRLLKNECVKNHLTAILEQVKIDSNDQETETAYRIDRSEATKKEMKDLEFMLKYQGFKVYAIPWYRNLDSPDNWQWYDFTLYWYD